MSHSLLGADRATHFKIGAIALIAATIVLGVGFGARLMETGIGALPVLGPALKASKSPTYTIKEPPVRPVGSPVLPPRVERLPYPQAGMPS